MIESFGLALCVVNALLAQAPPVPPPAGHKPPPAIEKAAADPVAAPAVKKQDAEDPVEISIEPNGVSIFADGVDAQELFVKLAKATGLKIMIDDTVKRTITVNMIEKKATEIIDSICSAYGLASKQINGVYMVSEGIPKTPSSYLLSDIEAVSTQYVLAPNAKSLLPIFLQDHIKTSSEQNAVILSGPAEVLKKFREDVKKFDIPAAQIMIEVLMVEFSDSSASEFAANLEWTNSGNQFKSNGPYGEIVFRTLDTLPTKFSAQLKAYVNAGKARVKANPRIATVSGQYASIFIGKQRYLSQQVVVSTNSGDYSGETTKNNIDAGVKLEITPWTGGDGVIIADVKPEISVLSAPDATTGLPDKSSRRANTTVMVKDGHTIVIGGLNQSEKMRNETKIPLLGDLPVVGQLFRSHQDKTSTTEMVIFITPHVLTQTGHLPADEEKKLKDRFLEGNEPKKPGK